MRLFESSSDFQTVITDASNETPGDHSFQVTYYLSRGNPHVDGVDEITFPGQYLSRPLPGTPLHMVLVTKASPIERSRHESNAGVEVKFLYHDIWLQRKDSDKDDLEYCRHFWSLSIQGSPSKWSQFFAFFVRF